MAGYDPYAPSADVLAAYQAKYGSAPTAGALSIFQHENATYGAAGASYPGDGGTIGAGLPAIGSGDFWSNLAAGFTAYGNAEAATQANVMQDAGTAFSKTGLGQAIGATSSALAFITDIPRVVTTLLGLILIIAGIFALAKGPAVNIVSSAVREAATS